MPASIEAIDATLVALSDTTRRRVVDVLAVEPMAPGSLARLLSLSPQSMSRHLRVLRKAKLIKERIDPNDARRRIIELRKKPLTDLKSWVESVEAYWDRQLRSFKKHVEGKSR